jgi:uncharacterized membrane-anchored protein YhcB (DUF1043 family)
MSFDISVWLYTAIAVGLVLLCVLRFRMQEIKKQRDLGARLERVQQRHGL